MFSRHYGTTPSTVQKAIAGHTGKNDNKKYETKNETC